MKKSILATTACLLIIFGCTKNSDQQKGYHNVIIYKNTLSVPVFMEHFYNTPDNQARKQLIAPGDSLKLGWWECLQDCPVIDPAHYTMKALPKGTRIYITDKVKTDSDCSQIPDASLKADCEKDLISLYNSKRWIETRKRDSVIKVYNIDKADSLEAQ